MGNVVINFEKENGIVKPMHATNNGPIVSVRTKQLGNFDTWVEAGIPFARNHDASFCANYGGEHTVDVNAIFPNFDADVNDPASYDFACTDKYTKTILDAGTQVFYRFGSKIEHEVKKYNTLPPKDFQKWAEICEHIIRHYNEGWADGFEWNIEYWEIWNEPDLDADDSPNKRNWGGTKAQFFDLFEVAAKHLKKCFPNLKIGGPAIARDTKWAGEFVAEMRKRGVPMDFFSWHRYTNEPSIVLERANAVRELLDEHGYTETESICNEWNYVRGWYDDIWPYSLRQMIRIKGAAYIAAVMLASQQNYNVDMLMYYDARPGQMNGMFNYYDYAPMKGYYPFKMFNTLYRMGTSIDCDIEGENVYATAAKDKDGNSSAMICYYAEDDEAGDKTVHVDIEHAAEKYDLYLLDEDHDSELIKTVGSSFDITLKRNSVVLLKNA